MHDRPPKSGLRRLGITFACASALGILFGIHSGCGTEDHASPRSCEGTCQTDGPIPHCVSDAPCEASAATCPSGLRCLTRPTDPRDAASCIEGVEFQTNGCRVPRPEEGELDALVKGFDASLMELAPLTTAEAPLNVLAFRSPADLNIQRVSCGLFVCTPIFGKVRRRGQEVDEITNFEECVVASAMFDRSDGAFDLGSAVLAQSRPERDPEGECRADRIDLTRPWIVSVLQAGCWGYNETRVRAATLLVPVSPSRVNIPNLVVGSCADKPGYSCLLDDGSFGTCDGECRQRCVTPQDCLPPLPTRPEPDASTNATADASSEPPDGAVEDGEEVIDAGPDAGPDAETDAGLTGGGLEAGAGQIPPPPLKCKRIAGQRFFGVCTPTCEDGR